jgi:hypothetical protein
MKKMFAVGVALCLSSTVALAQPELGDATYLPAQKTKSDLSRAQVLSKTESTNIANFQDGTYSPSVASSGVLTRSEVVRKMEGFQFADFGDGTNPQPWVRSSEAPRSLAKNQGSK